MRTKYILLTINIVTVLLVVAVLHNASVVRAESPTIKFNETITVKRIPSDQQAVESIVQYSLVAQTATVAVAQAASSTAALQNLNLVEYIKFLFSFFVAKRKAKKDFWGLVYDVNSSKAVPFAVIRIFTIDSDKLVATTVSDIEGKYGILLDPGKYQMRIEHQDYNFNGANPNAPVLNNDLNIYRGEVIEVKESVAINYNIPLTPKVLKSGLSWAKIRKWWKESGIAELGSNPYFIMAFFVLNLVLLYLNFHILYLVLTVYYAFFLVLHLFAFVSKPPRTWGLVVNSSDSNPIANAFIKVFVKGSEKLVDTKISDNHGRFQFFMPNGEYTLIAQAAGFKFPSAKYQANTSEPLLGQLPLSVKNNALNLDLFLDPELNPAPSLTGVTPVNKFGYAQGA